MVTEKFGDMGGTGLELRNGYLYFASPTAIGRFKLTPGELKPAGPAEIVVDGFPTGGGHAEKDIAFDNSGNVYINIGLPSNACQIRIAEGAPVSTRCPQIEERGGYGGSKRTWWARSIRRARLTRRCASGCGCVADGHCMRR